MKIIIRKATSNDAEAVVGLHQAAFENFFLTSLGTKFLELYYKTFITSENSVFLCAEKDNEVVGYSACAYQSRGFYSSLIKKHLFRYGIEAIRLIFTKPKALLRLMRNLDKETKDPSIVDEGQYAELFFIAVSPKCQGEGVGRRLLTETEEDVIRHTEKISLTTDFYNNDKTIAFYHALGYEGFYDFVTYPDRRMWRMIKKLK